MDSFIAWVGGKKGIKGKFILSYNDDEFIREKQSSDTCNFNVNKISDNLLLIKFSFLEKGEAGRVTLYHTGPEDVNLKVSGKMKEGKVIDRTMIENVTKEVVFITTSIPFGSSLDRLFYLHKKLLKIKNLNSNIKNS